MSKKETKKPVKAPKKSNDIIPEEYVVVGPQTEDPKTNVDGSKFAPVFPAAYSADVRNKKLYPGEWANISENGIRVLILAINPTERPVISPYSTGALLGNHTLIGWFTKNQDWQIAVLPSNLITREEK